MTIRVFMSGQSNALGRGTGGHPWSAIDSRVRVWDNTNPLGGNGSAWRSAAVARSTYGTFDNSDRNNFGVWFAHRLAQIRDDDVDFTIAARGATAIESWRPGGTYPMLQECIDVWSATGQDPAHVFLWHQGEGNVGGSASSYKSAFLGLVSDLTSAGVIDVDATIILGGLSEDNSNRINFNNDVLRALADENEKMFYANSSGLSSYDGTHFTGDSLFAMGAERAFAAYAEAEGIKMADLFALINEGGTPGDPGTGENKLYNLLNLALIGMGKKDVTESPDFAGTLPIDGLMTAGMLAAGAVVEYGTDGAKGSFVRFESGLQICWARLVATYSAASVLTVPWEPARAFVDNSFFVSAVPNLSLGVNNFSGAKRGGSLLTTNGFVTTQNGNIRLESNALYTGGDETCGVFACAVGFWK